MKHDNFNIHYNLFRINKLNLPQTYVDWLILLNTPHHQDALHIARKFLINANNEEFKKVQSSVEFFYEYRHLIEPKHKDIKNFKTFKDLLTFEVCNWKKITSNIKLTKRMLAPLAELVDNRFTVYKATTFTEAAALTHAHPGFNGNYYKFCHGINQSLFDYHTTLNEQDYAFNIFKRPIKNCCVFYHIRDFSKSANFHGTIPNCIFEDPQHIIVLTIGLKICLGHAYYREYTYYKTIDEVISSHPELECLLPWLSSGAPGWI